MTRYLRNERTLALARRLVLPAAAVTLIGCGGGRPPNALLNARDGVAHAKSSPAAQLAPAETRQAELALQRAETAFAKKGDTYETRDLARIAQLKAGTAEAKAGTIALTRFREQAERQAMRMKEHRMRTAEGETAEERARRKEAEARLKAALAEVAEVKSDARGTVITIPGAVLFKTAQSDIMPPAKAKLDKVAESLKGQDDHIVVVGHTDSRGDPQFNEKLSDERADAVRDHLVAKGIPPERITVEGKGERQPIADNQSVEGRALNRRVEIIVKENNGSQEQQEQQQQRQQRQQQQQQQQNELQR